jgi:hypothetical protein
MPLKTKTQITPVTLPTQPSARHRPKTASY